MTRSNTFDKLHKCWSGHGSPWALITHRGIMFIKCRTRAQGVAGQFLDGLTLTDCSSIQGRWVGTASGPLLIAPPTATRTNWPFCPCRPASIHYTGRNRRSCVSTLTWIPTSGKKQTDFIFGGCSRIRVYLSWWRFTGLITFTRNLLDPFWASLSLTHVRDTGSLEDGLWFISYKDEPRSKTVLPDRVQAWISRRGIVTSCLHKSITEFIFYSFSLNTVDVPLWWFFPAVVDSKTSILITKERLMAPGEFEYPRRTSWTPVTSSALQAQKYL